MGKWWKSLEKRSKILKRNIPLEPSEKMKISFLFGIAYKKWKESDPIKYNYVGDNYTEISNAEFNKKYEIIRLYNDDNTKPWQCCYIIDKTLNKMVYINEGSDISMIQLFNEKGEVKNIAIHSLKNNLALLCIQDYDGKVVFADNIHITRDLGIILL